MLSENKMIAVELLMQNATKAEAAKAAGVNRITVYRWLKCEEFQAELTKWKSAIIEDAARKTAGALEAAIDVLIELLNSKQANIKRLAAGNLIEYNFKFSDLTDVQARIQALEDHLGKK